MRCFGHLKPNLWLAAFYAVPGWDVGSDMFCRTAARAACLLAVTVTLPLRCFSAHDGHLVWPGVACWEQTLQMPSSFARWRCRFWFSRRDCRRSGCWFLGPVVSAAFFYLLLEFGGGRNAARLFGFGGFATLGGGLGALGSFVFLLGNWTVRWKVILLEHGRG